MRSHDVPCEIFVGAILRDINIQQNRRRWEWLRCCVGTVQFGKWLYTGRGQESVPFTMSLPLKVL